jgi:purine-binding chemotaxis protein CheW
MNQAVTTSALNETQAGSSEAIQLVVFKVDKSEYALPVSNVGEILRMVAISPVPEAPEWLPGVINLRGRVIPVIDLRTRLGLPAVPVSINTPILVTEAQGHTVGLVADAVTELLTVPLDDIAPPDELASHGNTVESVARAGERLILIFDLDNVCAGSEKLVGAR